MMPHPPHKRFLSRVVFYSGVLAIAMIMRLATPDPNAGENGSEFIGGQDISTPAPVFDSEPARAYFAFPPSH